MTSVRRVERSGVEEQRRAVERRGCTGGRARSGGSRAVAAAGLYWREGQEWWEQSGGSGGSGRGRGVLGGGDGWREGGGAEEWLSVQNSCLY